MGYNLRTIILSFRIDKAASFLPQTFCQINSGFIRFHISLSQKTGWFSFNLCHDYNLSVHERGKILTRSPVVRFVTSFSRKIFKFEIISSFLQESINKLFLCDCLVFFKICQIIIITAIFSISSREETAYHLAGLFVQIAR